MIMFYRRANVANGKMVDALGFAKQIAAYVTQVTSKEVQVAVPFGGNPNRVGWAAKFSDLGEFERLMGGLMADGTYQRHVAEGAANFIPGTVEDDIWNFL